MRSVTVLQQDVYMRCDYKSKRRYSFYMYQHCGDGLLPSGIWEVVGSSLVGKMIGYARFTLS